MDYSSVRIRLIAVTITRNNRISVFLTNCGVNSEGVFFPGPAVPRFHYFCNIYPFLVPKTSRYLASFLCFVGCFILSTLLQIRIKTFNLLLSPNLSAILLICASATFLLINLVSTFSTQFQPFLHSISAFCIIWSLYGIN